MRVTSSIVQDAIPRIIHRAFWLCGFPHTLLSTPRRYLGEHDSWHLRRLLIGIPQKTVPLQ